MSAACLTINSLHSYYGESHILRGISFTVAESSVARFWAVMVQVRRPRCVR